MSTPVFVPKPAPVVDQLNYDLETGMIKDCRQGRVIWVPEDLIEAIHSIVRHQMKGAAEQTLYNFGRYWGERFYKQVETQILHDHPSISRIQDVSVREFIKTCDGMWADFGWGHFELVQAHGQIFLDLYNSPYAQTIGRVGENVDHMFAGMFAGIMSKLSGPRLDCVEIKCFSNGYDYCQFVHASEPVVAAIKTWQSQGAAYEDIIHRIQYHHALRVGR